MAQSTRQNVEVFIRRATPADAEGIRAVIQDVYVEYGWPWEPDSYHQDLYHFDDHYLIPACDFFVAECDGMVVGAGGLVTFDLIGGTPGELVSVDGTIRIAGTDCEIARLYVLKQHRGKGMGKAINNAIVDAARHRGCKAIEIWSDKRLHEAHNMYKGIGAAPAGERLCHDVEQSPEWGFMMVLS